ncbi:MAG: molybdopterin-dependent oxidoreductase [Ardenticatenaceae bacterium]|nr:molybdopterin-dependent oxidoreductase [Ardenticatenaceae bacterium]
MGLKPLSQSIRAYDRVVRTTCSNMCEAGCGMLIYVKDGRVVDIWGDPDHPLSKGALCPKGIGAFQHIYNPLRIKYPLIRKSLDDDFQRVSWDNALDFAAERLIKIRDEYGPESLMIHRTGRSDMMWKSGAARFARIYGTPNVVGQGPICCESPGVAINYTFGAKDLGRLTNPTPDWVNSRCILGAGSSQANNHPVEMQWLLEAKERGCKIIWVDPRFNTTMMHADIAIRLRPNTDAALVMAMIHVILKEDLYDKEFCARWVHGLDEWVPLIEEMPPDRAASITWVPAATIVAAARLFATSKPASVTGCLGTAQTYNSSNINRCYAALVAITGNIGIPGGGWNWLHNCRPPMSAGKDLAQLPPIKAPVISDKLVGWADVSAAGFSNAVFTGKPYPIKGIWWNGNMLAQMPGTQKYASGIKQNCEIVIHNSFHPNFTQRHAHVSFPITSWVEREGMVHHGNNRQCQWYNQCIEPNWECRNDADVVVGIADRVFGKEEGLRWFPWRRAGSPELVDLAAMVDWIQQQESFTYGIIKKTMDPETTPAGGVMWPAFSEEEAMGYEFPEANLRGKWIMYQDEPFPEDPLGRRFPTPSGKIEIASQALADLGWDYLPQHREGGHTPVSTPEDFGKHPIVLCTGRPVSSFHEMGHWWPWTDELEPDRYIQIHPRLAAVLGIKDGDYIKLESMVSELDGYAWVTQETDPRQVWVYCSTDEYQPFVPGITNRNVSWLVDDIVKDPVYGQAEFKAQLVLVWKKGSDKEEARRKIHEFLKQFPEYQVDTEKELGAYANNVARAGAPTWDPTTKKLMWQGEPAPDGNALPFSQG